MPIKLKNMNEIKPTVSFEDFSKLDIRVGTIVVCEPVDGSEKLYRLEVDFGQSSNEAGTGKKQILAGIKKFYSIEQLLGRQAIFVLNLAPRDIMGLTSNGMLIVAHGEERSAVLYILDQKVENGSTVS